MPGDVPGTVGDRVDKERWGDGKSPYAKTSRRTELTPDEWHDEIKRGVKFREEEARSDRWEDLRRTYKNHFAPEVQPYNMIYQAVEDLRSLLVARSPGVTVTAEDAKLEDHVPILETVLNKLIRIMGLKRQLRETTTDAVLYGTRILKCGYDSQFGFYPETALEKPDLTLDAESLGTSFGRGGQWLEYTEEINPGMPWVQRVSPWMFILPYGTPSIQTSRWVAHNIWRPLDDVKADAKFKNTSNVPFLEFAPDMHARGETGEEDQHNPLIGVPRGIKVVSLWEIWDVRTGNVYVICGNYPRFLRKTRSTLMAAMESHPFVAYSPHADSDCFWGLSDTEYLRPLQEEMNEARTQFRDYRRISIPKILAPEGAMDDTEIQQFLSRKPKAICKYNPSLGEIKFWNPDISKAEHLTHIRQIIQEGRDVLGLPRIARGGESGPPRKTKAQVEYMMAGASVKPDTRREAVSKMVVDAMRRVMSTVFRFWDQERAVQISREGAQAWETFVASRMAGRYSLEVRADSMAPVDRRTKMQTALLLYDRFKGHPNINQEKLAKKVFAQFDGWDDEDLVIPTQGMQPGGQPSQPGGGMQGAPV